MRWLDSWPFSVALLSDCVVVCALIVATALTHK